MADEGKEKSATDQTTAEQRAEDGAKQSEEPKAAPKLSMKQRMAAQLAATNERYAEKYPKAHARVSRYCKVLNDVWQETFPNTELKVQDKMALRKERAKLAREMEEKQKNMTPEEIAAMEESIPEWKRNALVIASDDEEEEEKRERGIFGKMKAKVGERVGNTEAAQKFYQSEEYKKI